MINKQKKRHCPNNSNIQLNKMVETDAKSIPPTHIYMYVLNIVPTKIIHTEKQTTKSTKCDNQLNSSYSFVH